MGRRDSDFSQSEPPLRRRRMSSSVVQCFLENGEAVWRGPALRVLYLRRHRALLRSDSSSRTKRCEHASSLHFECGPSDQAAMLVESARTFPQVASEGDALPGKNYGCSSAFVDVASLRCRSWPPQKVAFATGARW